MQDIYTIRLNQPVKAIAHPTSQVWQPVNGYIVGREHNPSFGSFRFIFKYDSKPVRKSTGREESWTNDEIYITESEVKILD